MLRTTGWLCLLIFLCAGCGEESTKRKLVVYSTHGAEMLKPIEVAFEKAYPDIDMQWLQMGASELASRIRAEAAGTQADVWYGGPVGDFITAENAGLLDPFTPSWADKLTQESTRSANNMWYSNWRTPEVIMYNSTRVKAQDVPKDWDDLLDKRWTGKVVIRDPLLSGTMKTIFGAMVLRANSEDEGMEWLKKLDKQNLGKYAATPTVMYERLKLGSADITVWNMADVYIQQAQGYPFACVVPASGTPVVLEGIAIVKGCPHRKDAELFYEFVTSAAILQQQAKESGRIPVLRTDVDRSALPAWMTDPIKEMEIDWVEFAGQSTKWMKRWKKEVRASGRP